MSTPDSIPAGVARVVAFARDRGLELQVERYPEGTRTAADAAAAVGCDVGQIVKSLVFVAEFGAEERPVVALVSGANRASARKLAGVLGAASVRQANADEVRSATGFAIGGVPPFAHASPLSVVVDVDLARYEIVHAAAGRPDMTFPIAPADLARLTSGRLVELAE